MAEELTGFEIECDPKIEREDWLHVKATSPKPSTFNGYTNIEASLVVLDVDGEQVQSKDDVVGEVYETARKKGGSPVPGGWIVRFEKTGVFRLHARVFGSLNDSPAAGSDEQATEIGTSNEVTVLVEDDTVKVQPTETAFRVSMQRPIIPLHKDTSAALWAAVRENRDRLSFKRYKDLVDFVLCGDRLRDESQDAEDEAIAFRRDLKELLRRRYLPYKNSDMYRLLKAATEAFLMVHCAVDLTCHGISSRREALAEILEERLGTSNGALDKLSQRYCRHYLDKAEDHYGDVDVAENEKAILPYFAIILDKLPELKIVQGHSGNGKCDPLEGFFPEGCVGIIKEKLTNPCFIELIWSYWHEEGMLVQTLNAISRRFQNVRANGCDPLANFETDPLRPLNNLLWGYINDEQHRLTLARRNYEYDHHYGFRLLGKAIRDFRPADTRSKFVEAFHHLLHLAVEFYKQEDDTTVIADGFPILNGLKEVHTILTEGQHNQYGDLPSTARCEMLMQQWILARPEFREFLPTRIMTALPEPWMDRVDAMKNLQGWTDVSSLHFRNLAEFGEQVLLTIRFDAWNTVDEPNEAAAWARFWRAEIQGYVHAYRAATGIDLTAEVVDYDIPSIHLQNRLVSSIHRR